MSSDNLSVVSKSLGPELGALAEEHMKHDLRQSDRDALQSAAATVATHTQLGSLLGLSLSIFLAFRLRRNRANMFAAFRAHEQPTAVRFAGGREEPLPDLTPVMKPSVLGDVATYSLLGAGGFLFGGQTGALTGTARAKSRIAADGESRERIERAFKRFQADALRKQADELDGKTKGSFF